MKYMFRLFLLSLMTVMVLGISGCSSDSTTPTSVADDGGTVDDGGTDDGGTDDGGAVSYAGALNLDGTVDTSSLSAQDQAETRARSRSTRAGDITEIVRLYVVDADGEFVDTNISCDVTDGAYTCPGIAGDQEYFVRYVQDLGAGRVLEMRTSVTVTDVDPEPAVIDPITTMIVETLVQAVQDAVAGLTSDDALISEIIDSVKTAITDTMNTLVQTGVIQIPSMIVDGDFTAIEAEVTVTTTNDSLDDAAGIVVTNDAVAQTITAVGNDASAAEFALLSDEEKMRAIFEQLVGMICLIG